MVHRGPDGRGEWSDETAGLAFRRLAIIDLDERSNQPLHLGSLHLVFNGEIYNYLELRDQLRRYGHRFVTEGDGEVLLHAWEEWGEGALERINGMFAFAIWDSHARRLTLASDPFGEKPLYWRSQGERIVFASTIGAILEAAPEASPDEDMLASYVALARMPEPSRSFVAGISSGCRVPTCCAGRVVASSCGDTGTGAGPAAGQRRGRGRKAAGAAKRVDPVAAAQRRARRNLAERRRGFVGDRGAFRPDGWRSSAACVHRPLLRLRTGRVGPRDRDRHRGPRRGASRGRAHRGEPARAPRAFCARSRGAGRKLERLRAMVRHARRRSGECRGPP